MTHTLTGSATVERSEGEAITRAQRCDPVAFEYLYRAHFRRVYSVCLRMIKNPADAEDLTQQAFLQLFRKIGTRPVSACSCCCMGAKDKQNTISRPQRAEMQPSPELDRKGTRTSRID